MRTLLARKVSMSDRAPGRRYPNDDSPFIVYAPEFLDVLGSSPQYTTVPDVNAHERPVYVRAWDAVLFTTVPEVQLGRRRAVN